MFNSIFSELNIMFSIQIKLCFSFKFMLNEILTKVECFILIK